MAKQKNKHCCSQMTIYLANEDNIINHSKECNLYTIPVHDGGTSGIVIEFCPWCGASLEATKRRAKAKED